MSHVSWLGARGTLPTRCSTLHVLSHTRLRGQITNALRTGRLGHDGGTTSS